MSLTNQAASVSCATAILLTACSPSTGPNSAQIDFSASNTGLIADSCLLIENRALTGATVNYAALSHEPVTGSATVLRIASDGDCPLFKTEPATLDESNTQTAYVLDKTLDAFALASLSPTLIAKKTGDKQIKLQTSDQEKTLLATLCATTEGLHFEIWEAEPYQSDSVWSQYLYLGYDVERTCP